MNEQFPLTMCDAVSAWDNVRTSRPLVYNITNYVTMPEQAHATLAIGASPVMAPSKEEAAQMCANADALLLNTGTPSPDSLEAMLQALSVANNRNIPVVLDIVGSGATTFRDEAIRHILANGRMTVLKGNYGEIMALSGLRGTVRGVDSTCQDTNDMIETTTQLAEQYCTAIIATGKLDYLTVGSHVYNISGGSELLSHMTGSGCMLGSIIAAVLGANGKPAASSIAALLAMKLTSERAANKDRAIGTFRVRLFDELSHLTGEDIASGQNHVQLVREPFA